MELMTEVPAYREEDDYAMYLKQVGLGHIQNVHGVRNLLSMVPQRSLIPEEHHGTKWVADRAIDFLETNRGRRPFLLKASWIAPHPPFDVVNEFAELYRDQELPAERSGTTPISALARENMLLGDLPNASYLRRMKELYFGSISHVDFHLGRILDTLEDTGLADNTVVLFTSDHGEMLGDYDLPGGSLLRPAGSREREFQYMEYSAGSRSWISLRSSRYKHNYYYGGARGNEPALR